MILKWASLNVWLFASSLLLFQHRKLIIYFTSLLDESLSIIIIIIIIYFCHLDSLYPSANFQDLQAF